MTWSYRYATTQDHPIFSRINKQEGETSFLNFLYFNSQFPNRLSLHVLHCLYISQVDCSINQVQGLIQEAKLDSFNLPLYTPTAEEVRRIIYSQETPKFQCWFGCKHDPWQVHKGRNCCQNRESSGRAHSEKPLCKRDYWWSLC